MRIGIVNDSALALETLRRTVLRIPSCEVAWLAHDGAEAVLKCAAETPALILMDLIMPVMDGVEATRQIMTQSPCAILVVTSSVESHYRQVFDAMSHGALDAINTPAPGQEDALIRRINLVKELATVNNPPVPARTTTRVINRGEYPALLAIGASTGGPNAIATVLASFNKKIEFSVVVIQHVAAEFAPGLATYLGERSGLPVEIAREGVTPEPGLVYVAATNDHLALNAASAFHYTPTPADYPYRPSVDVFFKSLSRYWPRRGVAALLTGMGRDGAEGLLALHQAGWHTVAQDQFSSIVYGMPKAAAELHAASQILPLKELGPAILMRSELFARSSARKSP